MNTRDEQITGAGGIKINTRAVTVDAPKGAVVIIHGYGDHLGRHGNVTEVFTRLGLCCYSLDLRGHGKSEGQLGAVTRWSDYLDDLDIFLGKASEWHGSAPELLFGHSMGGLVAACHVLQREHAFKKLILSSPFFAVKIQVPALKLAAAKILGKILPKVSMPGEIQGSMLSHDPAVGEAYMSDPLVHKVVNTRWFSECLAAQEYCLNNASKLEMDSLLEVYGQADPLVSPQASQDFYDGLTVEERTCISYPDMRHELFNEAEKEKPLGDLEAWLAERL